MRDYPTDCVRKLKELRLFSWLPPTTRLPPRLPSARSRSSSRRTTCSPVVTDILWAAGSDFDENKVAEKTQKLDTTSPAAPQSRLILLSSAELELVLNSPSDLQQVCRSYCYCWFQYISEISMNEDENISVHLQSPKIILPYFLVHLFGHRNKEN